MVNLVALERKLLHGLMKMAGVRPYTVELEPGTVMSFWVPSATLTKHKKKGDKPRNTAGPSKPAVVLVHGFAADGIMTWQFQVAALKKKYAVYVPDLLFFGGSRTDKLDRSPEFQAECVATGLKKLGVEKCVVVGFSYGGVVSFKMAEMYPDIVKGLVISGSVMAMSESINATMLKELGVSSFSELLLPTSVTGLKALLSLGAHRKLLFPNRFYKDFLEVMFTNRKERKELLESLIVSDENMTVPNFPQRIHLLWGENDQIFKQESALNMKQQLGDGTMFEAIKKSGHLVNMERPKLYNRCLKQFIASFLESNEPKN